MLTQFFKKIRDIPLSPCIYNLTGSSIAFFLAMQEGPFIMVEPTEEAARELYKDILFFRLLFPSSDIAPNTIFFLPEPNGPEVCGQRAEVIYNFKHGDSIVTSKDALADKVWAHEELKDKVLHLKTHLEMSRDILEKRLIDLGYKHVSIVVEHGEFNRRGWLFDIFPPVAESPLRVEFFGDYIEKIKTFDISTQKSITEIKEILIMPASEASDGTDIFSVAGNINFFYSDSVHFSEDFIEANQSRVKNSIMLSRFSFSTAPYLAVSHLEKDLKNTDSSDAGLLSMTGHGIYHNERKSIYEFPDALKKLLEDNRVLIVSSSRGQAERIRDVLMNSNVIAPVIANEDVGRYEGKIAITIGQLSSGFFLPGLLILTEKEIFGERPAFKPMKKSRVSELLFSLDDLNEGDFVVHREHGIGKFIGLSRQSVEGYEGDLMILEYSGGDRLYLPLYRIDMINKYHAEEGVIPGLDRLGGKTWLKTKERVKRKIKEMAEKLLRLYAEREISKGFKFTGDSELHREFDGFFPYEETEDQIKAIEEIKADMESERPMDRLLCGDVGYGKTEVAMRAAFKAVYDGKQVAVLVPTTLLCEQHYRTFKQRFSAFPVTIDYLSRFKSGKEQSETIKKFEKGEGDILIGTHAILKQGIAFYNLGLLIIDEEHRFGVTQKERLKELKKGIDVLTLTATPIPRTLNMALSGIRDMSLIETPPEERLAVRSMVSVFNEDIIRDAIERELQRRGQTFFVHNRIADIEKIFSFVRRIVPGARVAVAHGQMNKRSLEKIMREFINREIDVLVSTAIVGSGLDIPSANTIIINRADRMGLADLYQLRGRVGRSNVRAYAYFLIPGEDIITDEAKRRLQAIKEMSYLGAGFRLAMRDLEIRGTGNLLGPEQSGHIHAVGLDMYIEMLEKAVSELKGIKVEEEVEPRISLRVSAFIPENFIEDVTLRLSIYRKVASAKSETVLDALLKEVEDRFGRPPEELLNLFDVMRLKLLAKRLLITDIIESGGNLRVVFSKNTTASAEKILGLHNVINRKVRYYQDGFEVNIKGLTWGETCRLISETLSRLIVAG